MVARVRSLRFSKWRKSANRRFRRFRRRFFNRLPLYRSRKVNRSGTYLCLARRDIEFTPSVNEWSKFITVSLSDFTEYSKFRDQFASYQFRYVAVTVMPMSNNDTAHPCGPYVMAPWHNDFATENEVKKMDYNRCLALDMAKEYRRDRTAYRRFTPAIVDTSKTGALDLKRIIFRPVICYYSGSEALKHNCAILCFPSNTHDQRYVIRITSLVRFIGQCLP